MDKIKKLLEMLAKRETDMEVDGFMPYEAFGGNIDDAYSGGFNEGQTQLARELLNLLNQ